MSTQKEHSSLASLANRPAITQSIAHCSIPKLPFDNQIADQTVSRRSAFSLLELLASITIIGLLAAMIMPRIFVNQIVTNKNACDVNKGHIEVQVQRWKRQHGSWPADDLSDMLPSSSPAQYEYFPDGTLICPIDGSPYTLDPSTHEVTGHNH